MTDEVRLEAFGERLKGSKIYCVGSAQLLPSLIRSRLAVLDSELAQRGRKVLIMQDGPNLSWLQRMKWDAVFIIKDASDLRLALTYVSNCSKPVRVVWGSGEPSAQVLNYLSKCEGLSLIGVGLTSPISEWDAVFWTYDISSDMVETALVNRMGASMTNKFNMGSVLKEIRGSELGLVWSAIGESDKRGSLYWFDPSEGTSDKLYSMQESADLLRSIADSLVSR